MVEQVKVPPPEIAAVGGEIFCVIATVAVDVQPFADVTVTD